MVIVEDWTAERPLIGRYRFALSDERGGHRPIDDADFLEDFRLKGLVLPPLPGRDA